MFKSIADEPLYANCRTARLERYEKDTILFRLAARARGLQDERRRRRVYRRGQTATCWFILHSGSVLVNNQLYLPYGW